MQVIDSANEIKDRAAGLFDHATDYFEARWNLGVLDASQKAASTLSTLVAGAILGVFGLLVLLFTSLGMAWLIGEWLNSPAGGYFCVAGFYAVAGGILYALSGPYIKIPITNAFIKKFYYEN